MTKKQKLAGNTLGRICQGLAIVILMSSGPLFLTPAAWAGDAGYMRIIGPQGAMDGASKNPAHLNWIAISSVVAADLKGDAQADRESSAPSVSEITVPREHGSDMATGKTASGPSGQTSSAGSVDSRASNPALMVRESPTKASIGATAVRESPTKQSTGKRMHKPFVITKELDKASPMLSQACASGQHFKEVDVDLASGGHYKLTDVMVSSIQKSSGGDRPMESVSFTFQKIEMK